MQCSGAAPVRLFPPPASPPSQPSPPGGKWSKAQGGEEKSETCLALGKECGTPTRDLPGIRCIRSHASQTPPR